MEALASTKTSCSSSTASSLQKSLLLTEGGCDLAAAEQQQQQQQQQLHGEDVHDVAQSFEVLHQSIPWLQKAQVSAASHRGQLRILQAAIDYIVDLEEQLTEHLNEDMYRVAIRESKAALERTLASRRPFSDMNFDSFAFMPAAVNTNFFEASLHSDSEGHQRPS